MKSMEFKSHVGPDGKLQLEIPLPFSNADLEVIVIVQPLTPALAAKTPEELGWPPGFFEETFGSFRDEPLVRGEQGAYEIRDELKCSTCSTVTRTSVI
jgi:hypothetical protein